MNGYDIFILAIVAVSIAMGLVRGLIREVFGLAGVVAGVVIALIVGPHLSDDFRRVIPSDGAAFAAAFLVLFFATLIVMSVLGTLLSRALDMAHLGLPNRLLGGVFGLVRGVLIALVITLGLTLFLTEDSMVLTRSRLVPHIAFGTRLLAPLLPSHVEEILLERTDHLPGGPRRA
ncbi:MAG TPA: CvpA family protein [Dongiaceae bacterium]|jgi:membrane protein required for colicin V production|nr:CvpA family protein [Dongiaceae bacterium]